MRQSPYSIDSVQVGLLCCIGEVWIPDGLGV